MTRHLFLFWQFGKRVASSKGTVLEGEWGWGTQPLSFQVDPKPEGLSLT